jgi:hypothetical protein
VVESCYLGEPAWGWGVVESPMEADILVSCSVCRRLHTPEDMLAANPTCPPCFDKARKRQKP